MPAKGSTTVDHFAAWSGWTIQPGDSIRIEAVQAWANMEFSDQFYDPIDLERTIETGLMHFDGTISMARNLNSPNSAAFLLLRRR